MFLLVPAYPGCPGSKAVKRSLLLLLYENDLICKLYLLTAQNQNLIVILEDHFFVKSVSSFLQHLHHYGELKMGFSGPHCTVVKIMGFCPDM